MTLIEQIKQIIENEAEKYADRIHDYSSAYHAEEAYNRCAELLLPVIEKLILKLTQAEEQSLNVVYESSFKTEEEHFKWFYKELSKELLNTLKGGEK